MILIEQRVMQFIILIRIFHNRLFKDNAFLHTVAAGKMAGRDVAHDHLKGNDMYFFYYRFPLIEFFDIMGWNSQLFQFPHQIVGHTVVDDTFPGNCSSLFAVKGCRIILVRDYDKLRNICSKDFLRLSFVELLPFFHLDLPPYKNKNVLHCHKGALHPLASKNIFV